MKETQVKDSLTESVERFLEEAEKACFSAGYLGIGLELALLNKQPLCNRVEGLLHAAPMITAEDSIAVELRRTFEMSQRLLRPAFTKQEVQLLLNQVELVNSMHSAPEAVQRRRAFAEALGDQVRSRRGPF